MLASIKRDNCPDPPSLEHREANIVARPPGNDKCCLRPVVGFPKLGDDFHISRHCGMKPPSRHLTRIAVRWHRERACPRDRDLVETGSLTVMAR